MMLSLTLILLQGMNPIIASAAVPGLGQLIEGNTGKARTFFIVEGSIWLAYAGFNYFGNELNSSARAFAIDHSGANAMREDDEYFNALEDYMTTDDYNLQVERNASWLYPDDIERQQEYITEHGYFDEDAWSWDTLSNRTAYWEKRKSARENLRRAQFMPGFALINRIVSVLDVVLFTEEDQIHLDSRPGRIGIYLRF
jgi:hypothetical protein